MWCDMLCSVKVKELVSDALTNPETSISTLDNEMKVKITYNIMYNDQYLLFSTVTTCSTTCLSFFSVHES